MSSKIKSVLYSLISGLFLVIFWIFINQMKTQAQLPISSVSDTSIIADTTTNTPPIVSNDQALNQIIAQTTQPVDVPTTNKPGQYKDGDYQATSNTPWGDVSIDVTVSNGRWNNLKYVNIPDSPPSQYAASYLAKQAVAAQGASINGVSGATYTSDSFRDDLTQIVQQSQA